MVSIDEMVKKFKGQMVRLYTWENEFIQGFFVAIDHDNVYTITPLPEKNCEISKTHITRIKIMLSADLMRAQGKVCNFLYTNCN